MKKVLFFLIVSQLIIATVSAQSVSTETRNGIITAKKVNIPLEKYQIFVNNRFYGTYTEKKISLQEFSKIFKCGPYIYVKKNSEYDWKFSLHYDSEYQRITLKEVELLGVNKENEAITIMLFNSF